MAMSLNEAQSSLRTISGELRAHKPMTENQTLDVLAILDLLVQYELDRLNPMPTRQR
jgi:hypothetical protein